MGQVTLTFLQQFIFHEFANDESIKRKFYLTGGTALSGFYLHHRESEDLDFFSENDFDNQLADKFIDKISHFLKLKPNFTQIENTRIYELLKGNNLKIKIDFNFYPYKRLKKGIIVEGVEIDSLFDIATNKLQTIVSRTEVKDFVDLYFLLQKFTFWDLLHAVKKKFNLEEDIVLLGSNFLKVEQFDVLPKMSVSLKLKELQDFYKAQAKKIGMSVVA